MQCVGSLVGGSMQMSREKLRFEKDAEGQTERYHGHGRKLCMYCALNTYVLLLDTFGHQVLTPPPRELLTFATAVAPNVLECTYSL